MVECECRKIVFYALSLLASPASPRRVEAGLKLRRSGSKGYRIPQEITLLSHFSTVSE